MKMASYLELPVLRPTAAVDRSMTVPVTTVDAWKLVGIASFLIDQYGLFSHILGGFKVMCGPSQELRVLTPQAIAEHDSSFEWGEFGTPILAGIAVATHSKQRLTSAAEAKAMFIEWVTA